MTELVSYETFKWILTILTGGLAGSWLIYDSLNLIKITRRDRRDPARGDKVFGYLIGIAIGVIGIVGCLRFHDVL